MRKDMRGKTIYLIHMIPGRLGFTLIELIVVVFVTAALAAIAIPTYLSNINKAKVILATSVLSSAGKALEEYQLDNEKYPASINFTNCVDGEGHKVFSLGLCDQMKEDLSIQGYSVSGLSYVLTARARDNKQTLLTLSGGQITQ